MAEWYYTRAGQQQGPVDEQALKEMLASGQLQPSEMVWREGMGDWQPVSNVAELANAAQPAAPAGGYAAPPGAHAPASGGYPPPGAGYPPSPGGYVTPHYGVQSDDWPKKATTAFVCSLVGIVCFGLILGIIAIVLGIQAHNGLKETGDPRNRGLAIAAIVIGILDVLGWAGVMSRWF